MRVIVHGASGRMGQMVCESVAQGFANSELAALVAPRGEQSLPPAVREHAAKQGASVVQSIDEVTAEADVIIDFSTPQATVDLLEYAAAHGVPVVMATTGHDAAQLAAVADTANTVQVLRAPNTSIGVALVATLAGQIAKVLPNAQIEIVETHHDQKVDVPSGTALMLAEAMQAQRELAPLNIGRHENGKRDAHEIGVHSIRLGNEIGTHEIRVATGVETITLTHQSETRALFAQGALTAAAWLVNQPAGLYTMNDLLEASI